MMRIRALFVRVGTLLRGHGRADEDLREEMRAHLEMEIEESLRRGMRPEEARRRAHLASGGLVLAAERVREQRGIPWIESLAADARYAVRHFRRTPLSTVTMIVVLALGIGTNVVLFTLFDSLATMPAPGIARDEALVRIRGSLGTNGSSNAQARLLSWPEVEEYAARTDVFGDVAAYADETGVIDAGGGAETGETVRLIHATSNYFGMLGIRPALGTAPTAGAADVGLTTPPAALISYGMWRQRFGGARDVIGRTVRVNDFPVEIAGVAPARFNGTDGGRGMTIWVPLGAYPLLQKRTAAAFACRDSLFLSATARLRPGVTTDAATRIVAAMAERVSQRTRNGSSADVADAGSALARAEVGSADVVRMLASNSRVSEHADLVVSGALSAGFALLVLLITCTNVSALMVGLAVARRREIGVRLSLGAPRARLVRQLLTESVLLALIAAALALAVTMVGVRLLGASLDDVQLVVNGRAALATGMIAVVTGILFGLSPALHATRIGVGEVMKGSSPSGAKRSRLQPALVVAQIALTQPLLIGLGVVIVTMFTDMGGRETSAVADRIAEIQLDSWAGRVSTEERAARIAAVVDRVGALPGVVVAMPLQMGTITMPLTVHPTDRLAGRRYDRVMEARLTAAPAGYFESFGIPILRGRDFDAAEHAPASNDAAGALSIGAIIVGRDLAHRLWGDADPLGRRLAIARSDGADSSAMVVVGVVDETAAGPAETGGRIRVYVPYAPLNTGVIARTAGPALPMLNEIRKAVAAEAPQMPIRKAQTLEQREAEFRREVVRTSVAIAAGGLLALFLSAIGLYAVVAFAVGQRTREIGIRTALGARQAQVVRLFFVKGLALSALGLVLGLPLGMLVTRLTVAKLNLPLTSSTLFGVGTGAVVLLVASVAVWIPARRASAVAPVIALRSE